MATEINIPYRCPNCGDGEKFTTLLELRTHLQTDHAFSACRSRKQVGSFRLHHVWTDKHKLPNNSLLEMYRAETQKLERDLMKNKEEEISNKRTRSDHTELTSSKRNLHYERRFGSYSPKSSFREYGLSSRLKKYLSTEKTKSGASSENHHSPPHHNRFNEDFKNGPFESVNVSFMDENLLDEINQEVTARMTLNSDRKINSYKNYPAHLSQNKLRSDRHIIDTLNELSHDVLLERARQHAVANSLYKTQEVLSGIEHAADERLTQQQLLIDALAQKLKVKEKRLANVMHEMEALQNQQLNSMEKMDLLKLKYDLENKQLHQELQQKQLELNSLNKQITETKEFAIKHNEDSFQIPEKESSCGQNKPAKDNVQPAFVSQRNSFQTITGNKVDQNSQDYGVKNSLHESLHVPIDKEKVVTVVKEKARQLEQDRQNLLAEMQILLEAAATDNDRLRTELNSQTRKLTQLNYDLEKSKQEQAALLDETKELYYQADASLSTLKDMLKEQEDQLISTSGSLEQAKTSQEKLVKERNECLTLAVEREAIYKSLMIANNSQVKLIREIIESSKEEKLELEKGLKEIKEKLVATDEKDRQLTDKVFQLLAELTEKEKIQVQLKDKVRRREEKLKKAKQEMERVTKYLCSTAEKELNARSKLELFMSDLIDRAGKAEADLQKLKSCQGHASKEEHELPKSAYVSSVSHKVKHFQDGNRKPTLEFNHSHSSRLYSAGRQKYEQQQNPVTNMRSKHPLHPETSLCPPSVQPKTINFVFENTPEIQRMITDVNKFASSNTTTQLNSKKNYMTDRDKVEQDNVDLSVDDNGIMWELTSPIFPYNENSNMKTNYNTMFTQRKENLKTNDDTDVDEDFTDYLHEDEQISHEESEKEENLLHKQTSKNRTIRMSALQKNYTPFAEKVGRFLSNVEPKVGISSEIQTNNKTTEPYSPQQIKPNIEIGQNETLWKLQPNQLKTAVDYSATKSSENSPLHRARDVQKRVQQLTLNSSYRLTDSSSKQSDGFEISYLERESDFSSSSYASLGQPHPNKQKHITEHNKDGSCQATNIEGSDHCTLKSSIANENKLNCLIETMKSSKESITHFQKTVSNSSENKPIVTECKLKSNKNKSNYEENEANVDQNKFNSQQSVSSFDGNSCTLKESIPISKNSSKVVLSEEKLVHFGQNSKKLNQDCIKIDSIPSYNNFSDHSDKDIVTYQVADKYHHLKGDNNTVNQQACIEKSVNSFGKYGPLEDTACLALEDQELARYSMAKVRPAKELRARVLSQSDIQATSSEDDFLEDNEHKERDALQTNSGDASTDTDLEKLVVPGHLQKGFVARKKKLSINLIIHKNPRKKVQLRKVPSEESISSDPNELDEKDSQKSKRLAQRKMHVALFRVFSYLDTRTLLTVSRVSKEWHRISRHPALWKHVLLNDSFISSEFLITLSKWCCQTQSLSLKGLRGRGIMADESPENYQLAIRGSLEEGLEKFLSTCHDTITSVEVIDCDNILTEKCLWLVSGYCRLLTILTYQNSLDPVTPQLMWALGGGCPGITSLLIQPKQLCKKTGAMNNRCLLLIGQFYPDIQELGFGGKEFDRAGLIPLVKSCQRLKSLHLAHCLAITADLASTLCKTGLKHLQDLTILGTFVEAKAIQHFKEHCRGLKKIKVTVNIQDCVDDHSTKKNKEIYKKIVTSLEALKKIPGFGIIFVLEAAPVS